MESRVKEVIDTKLGNLQENINTQKDEFALNMVKFENSVTEIKKETSWKIPDLEKMMAARITESKCDAIMK